ncbi:uncharacterized protein LOC111713378 [Eurytemora carolleeae]|uniref:uncharacterized protein LOC111713378 n=1 Tax=Eurytemora carolleeae TaxID=1294199 RepID=UPI000C7926E7|nr:uncharacterized protein LOC111713378 [Eurytemora carolleeae]|eukprot:XP_023343995.1 uncharacterized protein LOC111713378 [Eurytemora affinis]
MACTENETAFQNFTNLSDSVKSLPAGPPVSRTDKLFLERVGKNQIDMRRRVSLSGSAPNVSQLDPKEQRKVSLRKAISEKRREVKEQDNPDALKDKVLMDGEKEIWDSGDWRQQIKDLNSSFSKLPPISKGKKIVDGKAQAFIV